MDSIRSVLFLGDSITADGRYVKFLQRYFEEYARQEMVLMGGGLSSETLSGLSEATHPFPRPVLFSRLEGEIAAHPAQAVCFYYGVNDGIYHPFDQGRFEAYQAGVRRLIQRLKQSYSRVYALTPGVFEAKSAQNLQPFGAADYAYDMPYEDYDQVMERYANFIRSLGPSDGVDGVVDVRAPLKQAMEQGVTLTPDGIHPGDFGHFLIARAILKAMFNITLTRPLPFIPSPMTYDPYPGVPGQVRTGYVRGREITAAVPESPAPGRPWVWRAEFLGAFDAVDRALLKRGWHIGYINLSDMYGCPEAVGLMHEFYRHMTGVLSLGTRPVLFGFSRGGLYAVNYALAHPDCVGMVYLDAPVMDMNDWPKSDAALWAECLKCHGAQSGEALAQPVDRAQALAQTGIPVLMILGLADRLVHAELNGLRFAARFARAGGRIKLIAKPECGHHPHSIDPPDEAVEWILGHRIKA